MPCNPPKTNSDKRWPYDEYYFGNKDEENRKHGEAELHWTGAESLEWYKGSMLRDTMHGDGDYRWRYLGPDHAATTFEGRFYNNLMHGYGIMSYADGRVFHGLWHKNLRWGPGVESHACLREDVGLWYGFQLIRLAWRPSVPSVAIDLVSSPAGAEMVAQHRILLTTNTKIIGEVNSALELLKHYGCDPLVAAEKWTKIYANNCTDVSSQLCHVEAFDRGYYNKQIEMLNEVDDILPDLEKEASNTSSTGAVTDNKTYYAWNNNKIIIHMMKHCYTHEHQRDKANLDLRKILSGSRNSFKPPGKRELDSRVLLMASYLGHISNVAQLVNECDVIPDVTDVQGNSAIMYAACGNQPEVIRFLVEAGGEIDAYNDACCTPLGVTLLRYAFEKRDIAYKAMLQALQPPPKSPRTPSPREKVLDWKINRDLPPVTSNIQKSTTKLVGKQTVAKNISSKDVSLINKKKNDGMQKNDEDKSTETDRFTNTDSPTEDKPLYDNINTEYLIRVAEEFSVLSDANPIPYLFEVHNMGEDVELINEEEAAAKKEKTDKATKKSMSKVVKVGIRSSRDLTWQEKEPSVSDTRNLLKEDMLSRIMATILQLLSDGADPRKVRCPQPALLIAAVSGCADLIRHLVKHGADINEVYPQTYGYSTLDMAVSGPLTCDNLDVIQALLENGANPDHRLEMPEPPPPTSGSTLVMTEDDRPTLLHAVLARNCEDSEKAEGIRRQILELLLDHGANPMLQYKGRSAVELAMDRSMELFEIFLKNPRTDLNAVINDSNQTILVKMFYLPFNKTIPLNEKLQALTNLLLFGADPLIKCRNGNDEYENLFVYIRKVLNEVEVSRNPPSPPGTLAANKSKSNVKAKKGAKEPTKPVPAAKEPAKAGQEPGDYRQTMDLVVECARLLYIRWLQAQLMKELIDVVNKYKHRAWTIILKEHKSKKCTGLWLTAVRCLEIWDILKTSKKKLYNDDKILKKEEKELIESEVDFFEREHKMATNSTPDMVPAIRPYVTPELTVKEVEKFNVCFECILPVQQSKIPCDSCRLISFCSFNCMKMNIDRINCHPCNPYLKKKYFPPTPEESELESKI